LGTPRELTDKNGDIRWSATYKAWGNTLKVEVIEDEAAAVSIEQALRFQGQYFDAETGLHYNRHRYYDPDIGRFLSQDPIGLGGGENFYLYAPNPVHWIDPLGLAGKTVYQKNWEEVYGPLPKGYQVHHIIPKDAEQVAAAKKLCKNFNEHHVSNLIALPSSDAPKPLKTGLGFGKQLHDGYHLGYNQAALHALRAANKLKIAGVSGCAKLAAIQMSLRAKLTAGDLSMYKGPGDANVDPVKKGWVDFLKFDLF
jgi:RHS repeat-associated protein